MSLKSILIDHNMSLKKNMLRKIKFFNDNFKKILNKCGG